MVGEIIILCLNWNIKRSVILLGVVGWIRCSYIVSRWYYK